MNNEKVVEAKLPIMCQCLGPYPVTDRNEQKIGQLDPSCYAYRNFCSCCWLLNSCCLELNVRDRHMNTIYVIRRDGCALPCCWSWQIFDQLSNVRGDIVMSGCYNVTVDMNLPNDS